MRQSRFYVNSTLSPGSSVSLPATVSHHIVNVLRKSVGQEIILFDGSGHDFLSIIHARDKKHVVVDVMDSVVVQTESPLNITLAQGLSKGQKMDFTLQKAVELGVSRIVPIQNQRSNVKIKAERIEQKLQYWRNVIISAAEQSGRSIIPDIIPPMSLEKWSFEDDSELKLVLSPDADHGLSALDNRASSISLLVGSEGGLNQDELTMVRAQGYHAVRLGPRVLRTETAALVAISILQARCGDLA